MIKGAGIIIFNDNQEVLLQLRDNDPSIRFPNHWVLIGGKVEKGETPEEAIRREIMEEMGIQITSFKNFKNYQFDNEEQHIFMVNMNIELEKIKLNEGAGINYFSEESAEKLKKGFNVSEMLKDFFSSELNGNPRK